MIARIALALWCIALVAAVTIAGNGLAALPARLFQGLQ